MKTTGIDLLVVGAGPAGLGAAIEGARHGLKVLLVDENDRAGGQLFKQIHKFFGSAEHYAGTRGFRIGEMLLEEARNLGVRVWLNTMAWGIFGDREVSLVRGNRVYTVQAKTVVLATGATENALSFPGSTLPGVMTAGAAQTMVNIHRVLPGKRVVMVGAGNVGLIVAYQLIQAGAEIRAVVEAADRVGGYAVHEGKIRRAGVPVYTGHTVLEARGRQEVSSVVLAPLAGDGCPDPVRAFEVEADTVCLAVGLSPRTGLARTAGCQLDYLPALGGHVPLHDRNMQTVPGVYVAGDLAGVEEASTALEEGRLAGLACALQLGTVEPEPARLALAETERRLQQLRSGCFGEMRRACKEELTGKGCTVYGRQ